MKPVAHTEPSASSLAWPALLAGVMATLVGIGLARFAYAPLIPALIQANWFVASDAVYLGAANLLGYLIGALSAHRLTERFAPRVVVACSLAAVVLSFWLCAWPSSFYWFFVWRLLSGVAGAVLLVSVPSIVLSRTPQQLRTMVGTLCFSGIGIGIVLAAVVIPALLSFDLTVTWLALGSISLACSIACDQGMRKMPAQVEIPLASSAQMPAASGVTIVVGLAIFAYALDAPGFVPHTVFWVDYLARENDFGKPAASLQWALFGMGAALGPLCMGLVARRVGWHRALLVLFCVKSLAVLLPVVSLAFISQTVSSIVVGILTPGFVAVMSGRIAELVGPKAHKRVWGITTATFAAAQAAAGYAMSLLYGHWLSYTPLFVIGSAALALGFVLMVFSRALEKRQAISVT